MHNTHRIDAFTQWLVPLGLFYLIAVSHFETTPISQIERRKVLNDRENERHQAEYKKTHSKFIECHG